MTPSTPIDDFLARWQNSGAAEKANYQLFLTELCDLLALPRPEPASPDPSTDRYTFEYPVTRRHPDGTSSTGFVDLYRAAHFVLETKQGTDAPSPDAPSHTRSGHGRRGTAAFDKALERAYHQARNYITSLPAAHGRPPFLIVCDVGATIDLYAEFTGTGGHYERFPDPVSHRIHLQDLHRPEIQDRLRRVWTDPLSLDPSRHAAQVTRQVAAALANLARSLEADGHHPQKVASFLQRCLFTMFAEDVGLLPGESFTHLLHSIRDAPHGFPSIVQNLWRDMATGAPFNVVLRQAVPHFNGGLFEDTSALPLTTAQLDSLIAAAHTDWSAVEPAIFGTLVERALDPRERHKLGAHYTPRSYVERLVRRTLIDPLRAAWDDARTAAALLDSEGRQDQARHAVADFHRQLCQVRVLDPACGTGNFLYVSLELLKRLEAEVLELLGQLGGDLTFEMASFKVRPEQFLGLELNARAVAIAQLVLWIGYFQWQRKTTGNADTKDRPLLPRSPTIAQQDAVLAYDEKIRRLDPDTGQPISVWDGITTTTHPVTGRQVPDESARKLLYDYTNPRRAAWPQADYIVGNPPFLGTSRMREALGDGYTTALRAAWKGDVPDSADFVMYWWRKAAAEAAQGRCKRFGLITTNSIHQTFNRRVIEPFLSDPKHPIYLAYAIPDHPWVDSADGAAVRIAMTAAAPGHAEGLLEKVTAESAQENGEHEVTLQAARGKIAANLQIGPDISRCNPLHANLRISCPGVKLHGSGFIVTEERARALGYGKVPNIETHIRGYRNGRDLTTRPRGVYVIDLLGLDAAEVATQFPDVYQHLLTHVKPERDQNNRRVYRDNWWLHGEPRKELRPALAELTRYIVTVETSKHRFFVFLDQSILPDNKLVAIAHDDATILAILSSQIHVTWSLKAGSWIGVGNDSVYVKTRCFETFPFPDLPEGPLRSRLRDLGERLDAHRKDAQARHPDLTLTGIYNVLDKLRRAEPLSDKDRLVHDRALVTLLKSIHDDIDDAVLDAYGWRPHLPPLTIPLADALARPGSDADALEQSLLTLLVDLNRARAGEESAGHIRWLRPDYQAPATTHAPVATQADLPGTAAPAIAPSASPSAPLAWPDNLPAQVAVIRALLPHIGPDPARLSAAFPRRSSTRQSQIAQILTTLQALGKLDT